MSEFWCGQSSSPASILQKQSSVNNVNPQCNDILTNIFHRKRNGLTRHPWKAKRKNIGNTFEYISSHCMISAKAKRAPRTCSFLGIHAKVDREGEVCKNEYIPGWYSVPCYSFFKSISEGNKICDFEHCLSPSL